MNFSKEKNSSLKNSFQYLYSFGKHGEVENSKYGKKRINIKNVDSSPPETPKILNKRYSLKKGISNIFHSVKKLKPNAGLRKRRSSSITTTDNVLLNKLMIPLQKFTSTNNIMEAHKSHDEQTDRRPIRNQNLAFIGRLLKSANTKTHQTSVFYLPGLCDKCEIINCKKVSSYYIYNTVCASTFSRTKLFFTRTGKQVRFVKKSKRVMYQHWQIVLILSHLNQLKQKVRLRVKKSLTV
jgi:hypothetical protein